MPSSSSHFASLHATMRPEISPASPVRRQRSHAALRPDVSPSRRWRFPVFICQNISQGHILPLAVELQRPALPAGGRRRPPHQRAVVVREQLARLLGHVSAVIVQPSTNRLIPRTPAGSWQVPPFSSRSRPLAAPPPPDCAVTSGILTFAQAIIFNAAFIRASVVALCGDSLRQRHRGNGFGQRHRRGLDRMGWKSPRQ